jgi:hypothetical protein
VSGAETPGHAARRAWEATGDWDYVAQAALDAAANRLLRAAGVSLEEVVAAVTAAVSPEEPS